MSKIMLVDGNSIANRAFYALPPLSNSKGVYTNAIVGFLNMLFRFYEEEKPDLIRVAFDLKAPTFRHIAYKEYKGQRKEMPSELRMQMPIIKEVLGLMNIPIMQMEGFEADDLIGTMAKTYEKDGYDVAVVSGDRDLLQVATDKICITMPKTKGGKTETERYFEKDVIEKMGVTPREYICVKALMGDASDNIHGVPGIGEKTAFKLIGEYKSLDNLYEHINEISGAKAKQNLIDNKDEAYNSQFLVTIKLDVPMDTQTKKFGPINNNLVMNKLMELETKSLIERVKKLFEYQEVSEEEVVHYEDTENKNYDLRMKEEKEKQIESKNELSIEDKVNQICLDQISLFDEEEKNDVKKIEDNFIAKYENIFNDVKFIKSYDELKNELNEVKELALKFYTRGNELVALSFAKGSSIYYAEKTSMLNDVENLDEQSLLDEMIKLFSNDNITKICYDVKEDFRYLLSNSNDLKIKNYIDVMIAYYVVTRSNGPYKIDDLAMNYLTHMITSEDEVFKVVDAKGKVKANEKLSIVDISDDEKIKYLLEYYNVLLNGYKNLSEELKLNSKKEKLFYEIENPLINTLAKMEAQGIKVNISELKRYSEDINKKLMEVTKNIYMYAGCDFNISSPKQLGDILFNKLGIESTKKTKTKTGMSTSAETLEKLVGVHPIIEEVLKYRTLDKLRSTYADGLFEYIDQDEKIHTTFTQTVTQTGRLSSIEPNLQNIPIKMELGRQIRKSFVPKTDEYTFIDADYSQVELRVMAHLSNDKKLIEGYNSGEDIHKLTASQVFEVPLEEVTSEMRSKAKAVNFGIIYGISAFGLSEDIKISRKEAESYIENYFKKYSRIKEYLEELVTFAKENGYSETEYGRQRKIDQINSDNFMQREFGKRVAMNSPVQGTAADIMKIAMVNFDNRIEKEKIDAKILLQVHDELLVETRKEDKEKVSMILKEEMENAVKLRVPLLVEVKNGDTWYEAK